MKSVIQFAVAAALLVTGACSPRLRAQSPADECLALRHHGKLDDARACFTRLTGSTNPWNRAEGLWGLEKYTDARDQFLAAVEKFPKNADIRVRFGKLFLDRFNPEEANGLFDEALDIKKDHAGAILGLAYVAARGFGAKAVEFAEKAATTDPKWAEPRELLAYLALEDNDPERARKEAEQALAISPEALDAMAVLAAMDLLNGKLDTEWLPRILKINPVYGEAWATAAHFFVMNRRYEEGIALYRKALDLNPRLWSARAQLGVDLMRLGQEDEARKQLEECYANQYRSSETVNSLRLLDTYSKFDTFRTPATILKLSKKESALLKPYFEAELERVIATYDKKYKMKLPGPVQLEVYPDHEDFAVRTLGMPGLGALGVTFGEVVAMDSPSGRPPGSFHWASTLWHEMSHVYVLTATKHRVPRWFTEGLAVYEESAAAPDWGDRLDPSAIDAIQKHKLLPVVQLDRGFIRPSYPAQVVVSYFQGGKICEYIAQKWGYSKLLEMIQSFAAVTPTPEVIQKDLGMSAEEFDKQFLAWLEAQTKNQVEHFADWKKQVRGMSDLAAAGKHDEVIAEGIKIRDWYPDFVEHGSVYELLANAYTAKGDKAAARSQLEKYSSIGGRSPALIKKLAALEEEAGDPKKAAATLDRLNYIYPEDEELHHRLGDLWLAQNNISGAIREYQAVLAARPLDPAASHFQLAKAYRAAHRTEDAREQALLSLEAAPGYKAAQKLLLELSK